MTNKINEIGKIEEIIIDFLKGEISRKDELFLLDWINKDEKNKAFFTSYRNNWLAASIKTKKDYNKNQSWQIIKSQIEPKQTKVRKLHMKKSYAVAAAVTLLISLSSIITVLITNSSINDKKYIVEAPKGSKINISLPDGSIVWLNAGSKLTYSSSFNIGKREVELVGEGYFDVTANKAKPFVVKTSHLDVKALGTIFNVSAYIEDKEIIATLVEGRIKVEKNFNNNSKNITLKPNEQIKYIKQNVTSKNNKTLQQADTQHEFVKNKVNTKKVISWKDNVWIIQSESLEMLARKLERKYNTKIVFKSEELKAYRFSGNIRNETLEQMLYMLKMTAPINYKIDKGIVILDLDKKLEKEYNNLMQ